MKQYKLKQWYPSLSKDIKEGIIVTYFEGVDYYSDHPYGIFSTIELEKEEVEGNDFWELLDEVNYQVLSYVDNEGGCFQWKGDPIGFEHVYNIFIPRNHKEAVLRVQRLSDGEEFKFGDIVRETITENKEVWKIGEFSFKDTRCFTAGVNINNIEKVTPLFKTEDGVEIYEGDSWFYLILESGKVKKTNTMTYNGVDKKPVIRFSTEKTALDYYEKNKPVLFVTEDGVEVKDRKKTIYGVLNKAQWEQRTMSASHWVNFADCWLKFSTKQERDLYVKRNRPLFSLIDIDSLLREGQSYQYHVTTRENALKLLSKKLES